MSAISHCDTRGSSAGIGHVGAEEDNSLSVMPTQDGEAGRRGDSVLLLSLGLPSDTFSGRPH